MKIGIISDTHNNTLLIRKALAVFKNERVEMIIHAGDMDMASILEEFKGVGVPLKMVIGNIDEEPERFLEKARVLRIDFYLSAFLDFRLDGRSFYVFHGNVRGKLSEVIKILVNSGKYEVIIHGHTHAAKNEVWDVSVPSISSGRGSLGPSGGALILNPGSLKPLAAGIASSVAVYDIGAGKARIIGL